MDKTQWKCRKGKSQENLKTCPIFLRASWDKKHKKNIKVKVNMQMKPSTPLCHNDCLCEIQQCLVAAWNEGNKALTWRLLSRPGSPKVPRRHVFQYLIDINTINHFSLPPSYSSLLYLIFGSELQAIKTQMINTLEWSWAFKSSSEHLAYPSKWFQNSLLIQTPLCPHHFILLLFFWIEQIKNCVVHWYCTCNWMYW